MSNQTASSSSSTSDTINYTPSPTPSFIFGEGRVPTPRINISGKASSSPSTTSSTPRYTPSSTLSSTLDEKRGPSPIFSFRYDHDRDVPLPSVERDYTTQPTSSICASTSERHASATADPPMMDHVSVDETLNQDLQDLRLDSTTPLPATEGLSRPSYQRDTSSTTSVPSIHVTPTPSAVEPSHARLSRTDSLVRGIDSLHMNGGYQSPRSPGMDQVAGTKSPALFANRDSVERSPSPSRRRRSGSGTGVTTHQVEDEDPPLALIHERKVQQVLANARDVTAKMAEALSSSTLHQERDSNIQSLHQQAVKLSVHQIPSSRIVGLVGDSGVGKSSLINSLLDKRDLARSSNSGAACTCVVTEYHYHERNDFIIHVDYFTLEELKKQFKDLLQAYREYNVQPRNSDITADELEYMKRRAALARSTFTASFRDRLVENPRILLSLPFDHALDTMVDWTSQILSRQGDTRTAFDLVEQCSSRLSQLTSEIDDAGRTCTWPFIRKIRVYLKAHILNKGLIIADLPGLRDLNSARQNITERYVRQCHQIFAVAMIGRATTDQGVKEVFELARRAALSNIGIVCTKSDDIEANEARVDWPRERTRIDEMQKRIDDAEQQAKSLEAEITEFEAELVNLGELCEEDKEELFKLERDRRRAMKSKTDLEFELNRHIINIRNRKVTKELQNLYRNHPARANLQTFCVSNVKYWKTRKHGVADYLPMLQLSGILELRRYCIGIVAESHLRATAEYIRDEIPAFLGSIELWIQAGSGDASAERKQQILEATSAIQRQLDELTSPVSRISDISHSLNLSFDHKVRTYMRGKVRPWSAEAGEASRSWQSWHHSSYSAFCRNYGDYYTKAIGSCCWNEEAIVTMKDDLSDVWNTFNDDVQSHLDQMIKFVENVFVNMVRITTETANANQGTRSALLTLTATFRHRRGLVLYTFEDIIEHFQAQMASIETDGLSPVRTSIIGQLMEATYQTANRECGTGSDRRRKTIITNGFSSADLFTLHRRRFKGLFLEVSNELETKLKDAITEQLAFVEADLSTLRDANVVLESEKNPEFRERLATELREVAQQMNDVRRAIDEVTNAARDTTPVVV